jgi:hypothetical protein
MVLLMFATTAASTTAAQESEQDASLLKAVFIYNFAKFTRWPENNMNKIRNSITLCSIGDDNLANNLHRLDGKTIHGRPIRIDRPNKKPPNFKHCHVLYIGGSMRNETHNILDSLMNKPILTVSEIPSFTQSGGMIELQRSKDKIRFIINLRVARDSGLELSARLLNLATVIGD